MPKVADEAEFVSRDDGFPGQQGPTLINKIEAVLDEVLDIGETENDIGKMCQGHGLARALGILRRTSAEEEKARSKERRSA